MLAKAQFEAWYEQLENAARRGCRFAGLPGDEVPDAVQWTLAKVWQRAADLPPEVERLVRYTAAVARNRARRLRRYGDLARLRPTDPELFDGLLDEAAEAEPRTHPDPERQSIEEQERQKVLDALRFYVKHHVEKLNTEGQRRRAFRNAFILARHCLRGQSYEQIAQALDMNPHTCRGAALHALEELQQYFDAATQELLPTVVNSSHFRTITEVSQFLRERLGI
jgi:RNA polymerase sigma factor (sigma-70 family)